MVAVHSALEALELYQAPADAFLSFLDFTEELLSLLVRVPNDSLSLSVRGLNRRPDYPLRLIIAQHHGYDYGHGDRQHGCERLHHTHYFSPCGHFSLSLCVEVAFKGEKQMLSGGL